MKLTKEAKIGSVIIIAMLIAAFLWVVLHKKETKYHAPYKYYSGDKPDYRPQKKSGRNKYFPADEQFK
ncbi:MAG: hypothetical protein J7K75_06600 [Desulfuromonas sp.]|nr:hypothetical protein [Desulfuromonas sp.]